MFGLPLIFVTLIQSNGEPVVSQWDRTRIVIRNSVGTPSSYQMPGFDPGPSVGAMLGNHFFPGIDNYNAGRYRYAQAELGYVIQHPYYLDGNSRKNEFMSTSHYLTGMIYMYYAEGLGRRNLAREHFEKAIQWNPNNYPAYIELARVFAELRITKQASNVIQRLLELSPPEPIAAKARDELGKFSLNDN